jgi:hypothetical protein
VACFYSAAEHRSRGALWPSFAPARIHLKTGDTAKDRTPLLTTILADAINLGLTKMAESTGY